MNELIDKMAGYLNNHVSEMIEADRLLEQFHEMVLERLEDDYNF